LHQILADPRRSIPNKGSDGQVSGKLAGLRDEVAYRSAFRKQPVPLFVAPTAISNGARSRLLVDAFAPRVENGYFEPEDFLEAMITGDISAPRCLAPRPEKADIA